MVRAVYKVMRAAFWNNAAHKKGVVTIMQPKFSLVHLTGIGTSPPEFIRAAAAAGYDCVSLRTISMGMPGEIPHDLTKPELLRETRDALRETGIIFNDTENTRIVEGTDVTAYEPHLAAAAQLGVRHILGNIWTPDKSYYTDQFGKLCELAAQYGQDISIEFVTWASVTNLQQTVELLRAVNMPNAGIMVDALHFYRSRVQLSELDGLPPEWFRFMHLCDCEEEIPTEKEKLVHTGRAERLYPGEGCIDMRALVQRLPADIIRGIEVPHLARLEQYGLEEHARRALQWAKTYFKE